MKCKPILLCLYHIFCLLLLSCGSPQTTFGNQLAGVHEESFFKIHAHRGGKGEGIENSIEQMLQALEDGADVIEFDVVGTADNHLVVRHDQYFDRKNCRFPSTLHIDPKISRVYLRSLKLEDIKTFECIDEMQRKYRVEELVDVLAALQKAITELPETRPIALNIETKISDLPYTDGNKDPHHHQVNDTIVRIEVERLIHILKQYNLMDISIIQSFDIRSLRIVKELEPSLTRSRLFLPNGLFFRLPKHLMTNVRQELKKEPELYSIVSPWHTKMTYYGFNVQLIDHSTIKELHKMNLEVIPWTANVEDKWKILADWQVDAIITDYPKKLVQWRKSYISL